MNEVCTHISRKKITGTLFYPGNISPLVLCQSGRKDPSDWLHHEVAYGSGSYEVACEGVYEGDMLLGARLTTVASSPAKI